MKRVDLLMKMVETDFGFYPKKDVNELVKEMQNMNINYYQNYEIDANKGNSDLVGQLKMQMGSDDLDEMPQIVDTEEGYVF